MKLLDHIRAIGPLLQPRPSLAELEEAAEELERQRLVIRGLRRQARAAANQPTAQIAALAAEGRTDEEIAEAVGRSRDRVGRIRREVGVPPPRSAGRPAKPERASQLREAFDQGLSLQEIADELGLKPRTVQQRLSEQGLRFRDRGKV